MALVLEIRQSLHTAPVAVVRLRDLITQAEREHRRPGGPLPAASLAEIDRLWDEKVPPARIAELAGTCQGSVYKRLQVSRGGVPRPDHCDRGREILEKHGPELRTAYEAGGSYALLAESVGIAPLTLRAYLVAEGVTIRTCTGRPRKAGCDHARRGATSSSSSSPKARGNRGSPR